jgi:hypothetical protein
MLVQSTKVARCAVQPFSVDLVQIQQEERLGLTAKSSQVEALIKGEYAVKRVWLLLLAGETGRGVPVQRE